MREILFRGKRFDNNEWVEGWYMRSENGICARIVVTRKLNESFMGYGFHDVIDETVGQYTGIVIRGAKVFEGDTGYIHMDGAPPCHVAVVFSSDGRWVLENLDQGEITESVLLDDYSLDFTITGSIHTPATVDEKDTK